MAEAIVIIGVVAVAAQFTDTGTKLVSRLVSVVSRIRDSPQCVQSTIDEVRMLISLAELTERKIVEENGAWLPMVAPLLQDGQVSSPQLQQASPLTWLESVWQSCLAQTRELDDVINQLLRTAEGNPLQKGWRKLCTVKDEERIERISTRIERYKTLLSTWYGQECLDHIRNLSSDVNDLHGELSDIRQSMASLNENVQRIMLANASNPHRNARNESLVLISNGQDLRMTTQQQYHLISPTQPHAKYPTARLQGVDSNAQDVTIGQACVRRTKHHGSSPNTIISRGTTGSSVYQASSRTLNCKCKSSGWQGVWRLSSSIVLMGKHISRISSDCPLHCKRNRSTEATMRLRQQIPYTFAVMESALQICWSAGLPSIAVSLRTEARIRRHPLHSFFQHLYAHYACRWITVNYEERLKMQNDKVEVAQKLMLEYFNSGKASPDDVDARGRTLLHLQMSLYYGGDEVFLARLVELTISMGVRADVTNDDYRTAAQQYLMMNRVFSQPSDVAHDKTFALGEKLLDWNGCDFFGRIGTLQMLGCVHRWPESLSDCGYSVICDIVLRRSINDLERYVQDPDMSDGRHITPLHFATAVGWLEGVNLLLAYGVDESLEDPDGYTALDIAIYVQCGPILATFLSPGFTLYTPSNRKPGNVRLPRSFGQAVASPNQEIQEIYAMAFTKHAKMFCDVRPFHELAADPCNSAISFAEKLYDLGLQNIEEYDECGMTPLTIACSRSFAGLSSFLLAHGANASMGHQWTGLRPGHFIPHLEPWRGSYGMDGAVLLGAAFKCSEHVKSTCRCSPNGYTPLTSMYRKGSLQVSTLKKAHFKEMLTFLNPQEVDMDRQWRCFVAHEIFGRLEMTHTCVDPKPPIRVFPEEDRLEIEDEEEEIFKEFESLLNGYDQFRNDFIGPTATCVEAFFDKLDYDLKPVQDPRYIWFFERPETWRLHDPDILRPFGTYRQKSWFTTGGKWVIYGHEEGEGESCMLRILFD